jgi:hypothetical protein
MAHHFGTEDVTYDAVSILYHCLQGAETYEKYAQDAAKAGDDEFEKLFRDMHQEGISCAERVKGLLKKQLNKEPTH